MPRYRVNAARFRRCLTLGRRSMFGPTAYRYLNSPNEAGAALGRGATLKYFEKLERCEGIDVA